MCLYFFWFPIFAALSPVSGVQLSQKPRHEPSLNKASRLWTTSIGKAAIRQYKGSNQLRRMVGVHQINIHYTLYMYG